MADALAHPLTIAVVAGLIALFNLVVGLILRRLLAAFRELGEETAANRERFEEVDRKVIAIGSELNQVKADHGRTEQSVNSLADSVQRLLVALPTNYVTKTDLQRLEDGLYERLDKIASGVAGKADRGELERKADRTELDALRLAVGGRGR